MKTLMLLFSFVLISATLTGQQNSNSTNAKEFQKQEKAISTSDDGTPDYKQSVEKSYSELFA